VLNISAEKEAVIRAIRFLVENKYFPAKGEGLITLTSGFFYMETLFSAISAKR